MTRIYLAASYGRRAELAVYAEQLEARGYAVTSRWLIDGEDDTSSAALRGYAQMALDDIDAADWFVCFLDTPEAGYLTGGKHVELGYALARRKLVYLVGDQRENVFHHLVTRFRDWPSFLDSCRANWPMREAA